MNIKENINKALYLEIFCAQCKYHCPDWRNFERDYYLSERSFNVMLTQFLKGKTGLKIKDTFHCSIASIRND